MASNHAIVKPDLYVESTRKPYEESQGIAQDDADLGLCAHLLAGATGWILNRSDLLLRGTAFDALGTEMHLGGQTFNTTQLHTLPNFRSTLDSHLCCVVSIIAMAIASIV